MIGDRTARRPLRPSHSTVLESLEPRQLLAGNVTVIQIGDHLDMDGDALGNEILVSSGQQPGEVFVQGLNNTLVNGTKERWEFQGINGIDAAFGEGDDTFMARDLDFGEAPSGFPTLFAGIFADLGPGDDRADVKNVTLRADADPTRDDAFLWISGENMLAGMGPTTGNDTIDVANTTIVAADGGQTIGYLRVSGEDLFGAEVTGGNDRITVTNTVIATEGATFRSDAVVQIYGDNVFSGAVGEGNDQISLANTTVSATRGDGGGGSAQQITFVSIDGDYALSGTTIGGGNDTIDVTNFDAVGAGSDVFDLSLLQISGDNGFGGQIGGGSDDISISNARFVAGGGAAFLSLAGITVSGDGSALVGGGHDRVRLSHVYVALDSPGFGFVSVSTGAGDDLFEVTNSSSGSFGASLGAGDDVALFHNNDFLTAHLDGGLGYDWLSAHNNDGVLTHSNFEEVNVTA